MKQFVGILTSLFVTLAVFPGNASQAQDTGQENMSGSVFDPDLAAALQQALEDAAEEQGATSISASVYLSDQCVWDGVYGTVEQAPDVPVTPDTIYAFGSITKTFIATVTLQLAEEGRLTLDQTVGDWLEAHPNVDPTITIRQLLHHSSGLDGYMGKDRFWGRINADPDRFWSAHEVLSTIDTPFAAPGDGEHYSNTNYILLGLIIEAATGNAAEQALADRIFTPLNLASTSLPGGDFDTANWANSEAPAHALYSAVWTAGAIVSTPRDIAKFGHTLLSGDFLPTDSLDRMLNFNDRRLGEHTIPMGLGVWDLSRGDMLAWGHGGLLPPFHARMMYLPDRGMSVAYSSNGGHGQHIPAQHLGGAFRAHLQAGGTVCREPS